MTTWIKLDGLNFKIRVKLILETDTYSFLALFCSLELFALFGSSSKYCSNKGLEKSLEKFPNFNLGQFQNFGISLKICLENSKGYFCTKFFGPDKCRISWGRRVRRAPIFVKNSDFHYRGGLIFTPLF